MRVIAAREQRQVDAQNTADNRSKGRWGTPLPRTHLDDEIERVKRRGW